jgi:broad specificity phosphatase PhoE
MDEVSVTRPSPPSTKAIVADEAFCAQVAALLFCDRAPIHDAFIGEPAEEVLEMVRWALKHEDDEGFETAKVLTEWARKRKRGAWSGRPHPKRKEQNPNRELARVLADFWVRHPEDLAALLDRVEASLNGRF